MIHSTTNYALYRHVKQSIPICLLLFFILSHKTGYSQTDRKVYPVATAVINMADLSEVEKMLPKPLIQEARVANEEEKYKEPQSPVSPYEEDRRNMNRIAAPSPSPILDYAGPPDEAKGGGTSGSYTIPPDTYGAVGLDKVIITLNNNYKVVSKTTGTQLSLVSMNIFWASLGADGTMPFDPRVIYDPYNNRWIHTAVSNPSNAASRVLLAISQTHDPMGNYNLYAFDPDAGTANWADFPMLGFNRNWVAISVNMFTIAGANAGALIFAVDYPALRAGTATATTINPGSGFCHNPVETYSTTENTLYIPSHVSSGGAGYQLSTITGTPAAPVFTLGGTLTRAGGGWAQPAGNTGPQQCLTACPGSLIFLDVGDAFIRSNAVFRNGEIWYPQSVGLPTGTFARVSVQWTRLNTSGVVIDGGRIDDPTADNANGGRWYTYPSLGVNSAGDMLSGFTKLESDGFAGGAYALRLSTDAAGTTQDPIVYKDGEDYYDKQGSGRSRWGDYSHVAVDPLDDISFWSFQEYAKVRAAPTVFSTTAKWGTWVAKVAPNPNLSTGTGNWNSTAIWSKAAVPVAGDDVNIQSGSTVTLNVNPTARTITVNEGATLVVNAGRTLTCKLIVYGTLNITGGSLTLGTNDVFISRNATLTGASSTSYFITNGTGNVTKMIGGGSSFEFPISATGSSYNALVIALNAGDPEEVFSVRTITGVNPTTTNNASCLQRTWNISEMTTGGNNATLTFKWTSAEHGAGFTPASAPYTYRHNGSTYVLASSMTTPVFASGIYSSNTTSTISGFSPWIVSSNSVLPVTLNFFTATKQQSNSNLLNWKATCSGSRAIFEVERSADGRSFNTLNKISADYFRCLQPFDLIDDNPSNGKNYYRIRIIDEANKVSYSNTIAIYNGKSGFDVVNITPNPATNEAVLNIVSAEKSNFTIVINDGKGAVVYSKSVLFTAGENFHQLQMANLATGNYFITVTNNLGVKKSIAFVKQ